MCQKAAGPERAASQGGGSRSPGACWGLRRLPEGAGCVPEGQHQALRAVGAGQRLAGCPLGGGQSSPSLWGGAEPPSSGRSRVLCRVPRGSRPHEAAEETVSEPTPRPSCPRTLRGALGLCKQLARGKLTLGAGGCVRGPWASSGVCRCPPGGSPGGAPRAVDVWHPETGPRASSPLSQHWASFKRLLN